MEISVLASGSSGNSTLIDSKKGSILIDAGIPARSIARSLSILGKDIREIKGIFVTHEHTDHIRGVQRLSREHGVPVFLTRGTYESSGLCLDSPGFVSNNIPLEYIGMKITPVPLSHDAKDPCGFKVEDGGKTAAVLTDFGKATPAIKEAVSSSDCIVLESNHDIDLLLGGNYPYYLKQRILSDTGHLSNIDAGLLVAGCASPGLKNVFLAHLSKNNNKEDLVCETFSKIVKDKSIKSHIARQDEPTEIIRV